jgi:predicted naringenin-chalcone synthase
MRRAHPALAVALSVNARKDGSRMNVVIAGFGTALPRHEISQSLAGEASVAFCCEEPSQARSVGALYRMSGVETRRLVILNQSDGLLDERQQFYPVRTTDSPNGPTTGARMDFFQRASGPLAVAAARKALERSGVAAGRVTHLITVTCSGFSAPGFDYALIDQLPLRPDVSRTQIGFMGCHAALNALRVARAFVAADPQAVVLVCCVELCSLHYQYGWDPEQIVANSLFADGAAACVVQSADVCRRAAGGPFRILASGSTVLPDSRDAMTWQMGDHGFRMTLSPSVPRLLAEHLLPWLSGWLKTHGHRPETIAAWAVHPGGPRILQAFAEAVRISPSQLDVSRDVLRQHGNMSSPTLLFILDRLQASQAAGPYLAIGFGPGLAAEVTLFE